MEGMKYKTKQTKELENFLKLKAGEHVTVKDICDFFRKEKIEVGTTTIYRNLEKMVESGKVIKYLSDGSACFEYIGDGCERVVCYHCKCEECGKLIHVHCMEVGSLAAHLRENHEFEVDFRRTMFLGKCKECIKKAETGQ